MPTVTIQGLMSSIMQIEGTGPEILVVFRWLNAPVGWWGFGKTCIPLAFSWALQSQMQVYVPTDGGCCSLWFHFLQFVTCSQPRPQNIEFPQSLTIDKFNHGLHLFLTFNHWHRHGLMSHYHPKQMTLLLTYHQVNKPNAVTVPTSSPRLSCRRFIISRHHEKKKGENSTIRYFETEIINY